jgi:hypothetical protein
MIQSGSGVSKLSCISERCGTMAVSCVDVGTLFQQQLDVRYISMVHSCQELRVSELSCPGQTPVVKTEKANRISNTSLFMVSFWIHGFLLECPLPR